MTKISHEKEFSIFISNNHDKVQIESNMSTAAPQENSPELKLSPSSKLNGFEWWRRTLLYQTGLGLNAEEKHSMNLITIIEILQRNASNAMNIVIGC